MAWAEQRNADSNIKTGSDSLWWAYVTITTFGYGDRFPVTDAGRIIGVVVLTAGVGLFGVFTGFLANLFLTPRRKPFLKRPAQPMDAKSVLAEVRDQLEAQERTSSELRARLEALEKTM
jgi:voltage-gated potassium channel